MPSGEVGSRQNPEFRPAARVLLIDDRDRVLLFSVALPQRPHDRLWITPGGGLDPGETREDAALRELYEETGLRAVKLGPCIWKRRHAWQWSNKWIDSEEWFYLLRASAFDVVPTAPDEWEMQYVLGPSLVEFAGDGRQHGDGDLRAAKSAGASAAHTSGRTSGAANRSGRLVMRSSPF